MRGLSDHSTSVTMIAPCRPERIAFCTSLSSKAWRDPGHLQLILRWVDRIGDVDGEHEGEVDDSAASCAPAAPQAASEAQAASASRNDVA